MLVTINGREYDETPLTCPEHGCGKPMRLRYSGKWKVAVFYGCTGFPSCRSTHGAHPDGRPLGVPATAEVKRARMAAHAAFDRLWKSREMRRGEAYRWLTRAMGRTRQVHIGEMNAEECAEVVRFIAERDRPSTGNGGG